MYSLLPDESGCKCVLGTLLYMERKQYGFSPTVADVSIPTSRLFGHVDYKLEISATPHNSIDHEPRTFALTTRYKELSALHSTLQTIHRQLYLKGKFPGFAEPKWFGATEPETVAERRSSAEQFLQFVLNNEVLCKSRALQTFIESSKEISKQEQQQQERKEDEKVLAAVAEVEEEHAVEVQEAEEVARTAEEAQPESAAKK